MYASGSEYDRHGRVCDKLPGNDGRRSLLRREGYRDVAISDWDDCANLETYGLRPVSQGFADKAEGVWGQVALDDHVVTFTHQRFTQNRDYARMGAASTCRKVMDLLGMTPEEVVAHFTQAERHAKYYYLGYDESTGVILDATLAKSMNISTTTGGTRRKEIAYCGYFETRMTLGASANLRSLPSCDCEEQSEVVGMRGVETFSQCEDGGFSATGIYSVQANVDASFLLAQPLAYGLAEESWPPRTCGTWSPRRSVSHQRL
ncbi:uncharacterized protein J7T54_002839 [Emericellopsis cladophorae]|uniref:Uncharacterized protein n=1 Tax=Emericellopsis cladophorae TaxID=2686198 RepID=A0A9P9XUG6_9HYPO|nr:uncharacterized protein J7T54_002839 [Emericellopsis cladophorae]KAI6777803.1 hypothetical protein J7T54_002839 [Emericellopsis cladophorae]